MLISYLVAAVRNLKRHRMFALINVGGLSIGMATVILILLWVHDELSFDRFHSHADRLFRVEMLDSLATGFSRITVTPAPLGEKLLDNCPEVETVARYRAIGQAKVLRHDETDLIDRVAYADPSFLELFSFPMLQGSLDSALAGTRSGAIRESVARRFFGSENPVGKYLVLDGHDIKINAVLADGPHNTHLQFDCLLPYRALVLHGRSVDLEHEWGRCSDYTYMRLRADADHRVVSTKIASLRRDYLPQSSARLFLEPVTRLHLHHDMLLYVDPAERPGDIVYVRIFTVVALAILLLACINFVNLSSARIRTRMREVGLRKTLGASRIDIATQFFGESMILAGIGFVAALIIVELSLPAFRGWAEKSVGLLSGGNASTIAGLCLVVLGTGIISGAYPSYLFASRRPVEALNERLTTPRHGRRSRRMLVVFQYAISIGLVLMTLIMHRQLAYVEEKDLGFDKNHLLYFPLTAGIEAHFDTFRDRLLRNPSVTAVARGNLPLEAVTGTYRWSWPGKDPKIELKIHPMRVDFDYVETLKLRVIEGRTFSSEYGTDAETAFMINEAAARAMGVESPIGKRFSLWNREGRIIGVVKDFHYGSLHHPIGPLVFHVNPCGHSTRFRTVCVRLAEGNTDQTIAHIRDTWREISGDDVFQGSFLDHTLRDAYGDERKLQTLFGLFVCLSAFISCLGLIGLTLFSTERRTKEVGIRKILGARVSDIVVLITSEFVGLVALAMLVAFPLGYGFGQWWLQSFAYRTPIRPEIFLISGGAALLLSIAIVAALSIRSATKDPVATLRYE